MFVIQRPTLLHIVPFFLKVFGVSGHMQDSCMVLIKNEEEPMNLQLKWESCFENQGPYGVLCEAQFGHHSEDVDSTCLQTLEKPLLEYRLHLGIYPDIRAQECKFSPK